MKQTVNCDVFIQAFENYDRYDDFGDSALNVLFDYYESIEQEYGTEMELDVIAICCEWGAYTDFDNVIEDYGYLVEDMQFNDKNEYNVMLLHALRENTTIMAYPLISGNEVGWLVQSF